MKEFRKTEIAGAVRFMRKSSGFMTGFQHLLIAILRRRNAENARVCQSIFPTVRGLQPFSNDRHDASYLIVPKSDLCNDMSRNGRVEMAKRRVFGLIGVVAAILVLLGLLSVTAVPVAGQARAAAAAIKTAWGVPDLQGIW